MKDGFICAAAGTPAIRPADCRHNAEVIFTLMREAEGQGVKLLALPELCLTGSTCGDLFFQSTLLQGALEGLRTILEATRNLEVLTALGMPLECRGRLYNCAVVIQGGRVVTVTAQTLPPPGSGFARWFAYDGAPGPFRLPRLEGEDAWEEVAPSPLMACPDLPGLTVGVDVGEDLWAMDPPARALAQAGATVVLSLAASPEIVGQAERRRRAGAELSARLMCAYVLSGAGEGESTTDQVFAGHDLIAENGKLLAEGRFSTGLTVCDVDVERLAFQRRRSGAFCPAPRPQGLPLARFTPGTTQLRRYVSPTPFVPEDPQAREERCREILTTAALGLKRRLEHTGVKTAVVGLSGGLDSTLAVLVTGLAMKMLGRPMTDILAVTMPCFGTTDRTRNNAMVLAEKLGASCMSVDIAATVRSHFHDIGQDPGEPTLAFENAQARERTQVLMDLANRMNGLVVGTGDLSEVALGWCTYNGDHMSMYGVNAGIPKTLVRHLVAYLAREDAETDRELHAVLEDILDTPVSPELLPAVQGDIAQRTEDIVGPYLLHDFFLYYTVRWGFGPGKVFRLALHALGQKYARDVILGWMKVFYQRFFSQQFKRSCMPDGPQTGTVCLGPRGGWVMPSDAQERLWMEELKTLG